MFDMNNSPSKISCSWLDESLDVVAQPDTELLTPFEKQAPRNVDTLFLDSAPKVMLFVNIRDPDL